MHFLPTTETFNDFLNKFKKMAKQTFSDRSSDITETFFFAKLPVQMQNELAVVGKHDASIDVIKTFVQRRYKCAQLMPATSNTQPFNQIGVQQCSNQTTSSTNRQRQSSREINASSMDKAMRNPWTRMG